MIKKNTVLWFIALSMAILLTDSNLYAKEVNVYSSRKDHLIRPLFEAYEKETGVRIRYITGSEAMLFQKIKSEGKNTPADMLITVDAGNLWNAAKKGLLQPVQSQILNRNIPDHLRDDNNQWFGLSIRARTIVYRNDRVKPSELSTYENLGNPKWKGKLCLRTSKKVYNQSLVAMFIAQYGEEKTESLIKSWVSNLSISPLSSDNEVIEEIGAGNCEIGIINSYYYGRFMRKYEAHAFPLALFWPNQGENQSGVHVNISGAGITKYSKNKKEAIKLLEWLSSTKAQNLFADSNMEYPVNADVKPHEFVQKWGNFRQNVINVAKAGELQKSAVMLMDRVGYR